MPLAGHTPVHPKWSHHHRPVASGGHTGRCEITRATGEGSLDPVTGVWHPPAATPVYSGPCRVTLHPTASTTQVGDQPVVIRSGEVAIEWDAADVFVDDIVTITGTADPGTDGLQLRVTGIRHATSRGSGCCR